RSLPPARKFADPYTVFGTDLREVRRRWQRHRGEMSQSVRPIDRQRNSPLGRRSESGQVNAPPRATCFARSLRSSRRLEDVSGVEQPMESWSREEKAIKTIQYAAMPGQNRRGIFHTCTTFQDRFCQVANLTCDRSRCRDPGHLQPWFSQKK